MLVADIAAMQVCQSRKDRDEQARRDFNTAIFLATAGDIVATRVHKFHKDCDEQVRCGVNIIISTADIVATKVYQF